MVDSLIQVFDQWQEQEQTINTDHCVKMIQGITNTMTSQNNGILVQNLDEQKWRDMNMFRFEFSDFDESSQSITRVVPNGTDIYFQIEFVTQFLLFSGSEPQRIAILLAIIHLFLQNTKDNKDLIMHFNTHSEMYMAREVYPINFGTMFKEIKDTMGGLYFIDNQRLAISQILNFPNVICDQIKEFLFETHTFPFPTYLADDLLDMCPFLIEHIGSIMETCMSNDKILQKILVLGHDPRTKISIYHPTKII